MADYTRYRDESDGPTPADGLFPIMPTVHVSALFQHAGAGAGASDKCCPVNIGVVVCDGMTLRIGTLSRQRGGETWMIWR